MNLDTAFKQSEIKKGPVLNSDKFLDSLGDDIENHQNPHRK